MSAQAWRRVEELFAWAVERDPAARSAELAERCGGDGELCAEVASLVAAWESSGDFLETPAAERIARNGDEADPRRRGRRVGRYRIVRPIGRGGMGVVYEARQDEPRRSVALKIVRGGALADPLRVRRFQREAESLGRLDHPGIARIFEAGLDAESGDPWFAMELVRGRPLAEYVRAERPRRAELLALFARLCEAVEHAHRHGVVHRDLKPSNVLVVAGDGAPAVPAIKVLDFGLAHLTAEGGAEATRLTEPGRAFGTLPYMSPEQARGEAATGPASDVYSLGVMLFELLTGRLPLDVEGLSLTQAVRRIGEDPPERPGRIDRALRGDLETIVAKTLEKDPARRYASAAELARDVERHQAGLPIAAQPPSVVYQAKKLVGRHKVFFGGALLTSGLSAAAAVVCGVLWARASDAERRARVEAHTAQAVSGFLQEMLASAEPGTRASHELSVREVLERAARRLEREPVEHDGVAAALHATIGDAYRGLGHFERAETHLEAALALERAQPDADGPLAKCLASLGRVRLEQGRYADAEARWREALSILRRTGPPAALAEVLTQLGAALRLQAGSAAELDAARALYEEALAIAEGLEVPDRTLTANVLNEYAGVLAAQGDNAGAEERFRRALELHRACYGELDVRVAQDENDLAVVLGRDGRRDEALGLARHALATYAQVLGHEHPTTVAAANNLGSQLVRGPELDEGEDLLAAALDQRRRLLGDEHPDVARTLNLLGFAAQRREDLVEARACYGEALTINRAALGSFHLEVGNSEANLALVELDAGDARAALPHARAALEVYRRVLPAGHFYLPQSEALLGRTLLALGQLDEAEPLLAGSLATLARLHGDADPATRQVLQDLAVLHRTRGDPEAAIRLEERLRGAAGDDGR